MSSEVKEYGGYIELDTYRLPMLHEGAVALNNGRNCLAYLIRARKISKMALPAFLCDCVADTCLKEGVQLRFYGVGADFRPEAPDLEPDEWLYIVNYYGQLTDAEIRAYADRYQRIILDQTHAYFQMPVEHVDTIYTCRKFFGVPDGAFLYTDVRLEEELPVDESFERMRFLLGRFERTASEFYGEYVSTNMGYEEEPIKRISKLTDNLLRGIDYNYAKKQRTENYRVLDRLLGSRNRLRISCPEGAFSYPLWVTNGPQIRKVLAQKKIYIPTLWPNVLSQLDPARVEYDMTANILPIPCDQRYDEQDMAYIAKEVLSCVNSANC